MAETTSRGVYQANFGFDRHTKKLLLYAALFVAAGFVVELPVAIASWVFFGGGGLFLFYRALRAGFALRVDEKGVTLCATPIQEQTLIPWSEITAIALWTQQVPGTSMPYVGVVRRPRVDELGEISSSGMHGLAPHVPAEVVNFSRAVSGWRLDRDRMLAVARRYVPDLQVRDFG